MSGTKKAATAEAQEKKPAAKKRIARKKATTPKKRNVSKAAPPKKEKKSSAVKKATAARTTEEQKVHIVEDARNRMALAVVSVHRFPVSIDRLAVHSARVMGIAFVAIGALLTYINYQSALEVMTFPQYAQSTAATVLSDGSAVETVTTSSWGKSSDDVGEAAQVEKQEKTEEQTTTSGKETDAAGVSTTGTPRTAEGSSSGTNDSGKATSATETQSTSGKNAAGVSVVSDNTVTEAVRTTTPEVASVSVTVSIQETRALHGRAAVSLTATQQNTNVELSLLPSNTKSARFLDTVRVGANGSATYTWDTTNTPNGTYTLYATLSSKGTKVQSTPISVSIANPVPEPVVSEEKTEAAFAVKEVVERVAQEVASSSAATTEVRERVVAADPETDRVLEEKTDALLREHKEKVDDTLSRFESALHTGDETQITRVKEQLKTLSNDIATTDASQEDASQTQLIEEKVATRIAQLEQKAEKTDQIVKERVGNAVTIDSDKDGITDFDEITLYGTDPQNADSDNDGFIDGAEVLSGFDPTNPESQAIATYESPQENGITRSDLLAVRSVETIDANNTSAVPEARITGHALPNSFVTLYIFSTPTVVTVKTDANGDWQYTFSRDLEDGTHEAYVGVTDNAGRIVAKSEPFTFVKTAQAFTPVNAAEEDTTITTEPQTTLLSERMLLVVFSISIIVIGLILILLGLHLHTRVKKQVPAPALVEGTV